MPPLQFSSFFILAHFWLVLALFGQTFSAASRVFVYRCLCLIGLSNCKQFCHNTIKTTSIFTFTISFFFSATITAEVYLTLNSFTTYSTRQWYISTVPNLKAMDFAINITISLSTVFGISPFQPGTIVMASHIEIVSTSL